MYYRVFAKMYRWAANQMCQDCQDFIRTKSKILDLGCGSAIVAQAFKDFFEAEIIGVDILDRRIFPIPFVKIDGKKLPFPDNSFDTVLIAYVLHHSEDPFSLLREAKRVSQDKILIYEDLPEGFFSKLLCQIHGISFDNLFQNKNETSFKTEKEWQTIFEELRLELIFKKNIFSFFNPVRKKLFVLKKMGM